MLAQIKNVLMWTAMSLQAPTWDNVGDTELLYLLVSLMLQDPSSGRRKSRHTRCPAERRWPLSVRRQEHGWRQGIHSCTAQGPR
jgi:hypothetical protein